jgi:hypothetical protein
MASTTIDLGRVFYVTLRISFSSISMAVFWYVALTDLSYPITMMASYLLCSYLYCRYMCVSVVLLFELPHFDTRDCLGFPHWLFAFEFHRRLRPNVLFLVLSWSLGLFGVACLASLVSICLLADTNQPSVRWAHFSSSVDLGQWMDPSSTPLLSLSLPPDASFICFHVHCDYSIMESVLCSPRQLISVSTSSLLLRFQLFLCVRSAFLLVL